MSVSGASIRFPGRDAPGRWRRPGGAPVVGPVWRVASVVIALGVMAPVVTLLWLAGRSDLSHWTHLAQHVLPMAALNTLLLLAGVGVLVLVIGAGCAWLVAACDFPGRTVLQWALLLPLAMPTYIVAFAYLDLLHPLGIAGWSAGWRVALPLARPALAVGLSLALLETLNDIGASEFLGVNTLTVAVYTTWVSRSDLAGAAQIACAMLFAIIALVLLERHGRRHQRFGSAQRMHAAPPTRLRGMAAWAATAATTLPVLIGFVAPALYLAWETAKRLRGGSGLSRGLIDSLLSTLGLACGVTVVAVMAGLVVAWAARHAGGAPNRAHWQARAASLGYALPGTVLAIGLLTPALAFDAGLATLLGVDGLPLMSAGVVLVLACTIRFLAMPVGAVEEGLARIPPALEQAARLLGESPAGTLRRVHLPLLQPAIATGALLVFVDVMKELPATLLLRPANFDTLATWLYAEAARGTYEEGAIAALAIVLAGLVPVALLARMPMQVERA